MTESTPWKIDEHVNSCVIGCENCQPPWKFNPNDYFVTSGDGIKKTEAMIKYLNERTNLCEKCENTKAQAIRESTVMLGKLLAIKGNHVFLETDWQLQVLTMTPKNPRKIQREIDAARRS